MYFSADYILGEIIFNENDWGMWVGWEQWTVSFPFDKDKKFTTYNKYGQSSEQLSNYFDRGNDSAMDLFIYLFIEFIM